MGLFLEITSRFGSSNLHKPKAPSLLVSWSFHLHQSHKLPVYVDFSLSDGALLLLVSLPVAWCNAAVFLSVSSTNHHFSFTANLIVLQYRSSEIYRYTEGCVGTLWKHDTLWKKDDVATTAIAAASCALMSGLNKSDCMIMLQCAKQSTGGYAGAFILPEVIASQPKKQPPGLKNEPHVHNNCSSAIGHFRLALKTSERQ